MLNLTGRKWQWLSVAASLCVWASAYAQVIPGINYQGVARDLSGNPRASQAISIRISIMNGSSIGPIEYSENHDLATNQFGLFNLVIGQGSSQFGIFESIDWSNTNKWLQVEMDSKGGSNFQLIGAQQLLSVPFAYFAAHASQNITAGEGLEIQNNTVINTAPDKLISLTAEGSIEIEGQYPSFNLIGSDSVNDADPDPANETISGIAVGSGNILKITEAGIDHEVDLNGVVQP